MTIDLNALRREFTNNGISREQMNICAGGSGVSSAWGGWGEGRGAGWGLLLPRKTV